MLCLQNQSRRMFLLLRIAWLAKRLILQACAVMEAGTSNTPEY